MPRKKKTETGLDLVDQLLSNEDPAPKKKRGRPKGSKNKIKPKPQRRTKKAEAPKSKKKKNEGTAVFELQFVTQEAFEQLGCPKWGYTTARIKQWKNKTSGYWEVMLEYHRAAILWSKLAKTIEWYSTVDERKLDLCRKEIEAFKEVNSLTTHDFFEVINIAHHFNHSRKAMVKKLRELAKIVLENRRRAVEDEKEKEKILFREVARIPPNVPPVLKYVKLQTVTIDGEVREAIADLTDNPQVQNEHACPEHLNYRGLRKPRNGCPTCLYFYQHNKKLGLKEKRQR